MYKGIVITREHTTEEWLLDNRPIPNGQLVVELVTDANGNPILDGGGSIQKKIKIGQNLPWSQTPQAFRDGVDGQPGVDGVDGQPGANGVNGADGAAGPQGPQGPSVYDISCIHVGNTTANSVIAGPLVSYDVTFAANFDQSVGKIVGSNTAAFDVKVFADTNEIGVVSFSNTGVVSFTTANGAPVVVAAQSDINFVPQQSVDGIEVFKITLQGFSANTGS